MRRWLVIGLVALATGASSGCGSLSTSGLATRGGFTVHGTSATTAAELNGRELIATSATGRRLVVASRIGLGFNDGMFHASGGCNDTDGPFSVSRGHLRVPRQLMWTKMACGASLDAQDDWLGKVLAASPLVTLGDHGRTVVLSTDQNSITFARRPTHTQGSAIERRVWKVVGIVEPGGRRKTVRTTASPATMQITEYDAFFDAGCGPNGMRAEFVSGGAEFGGVLRRRRRCSGHAAYLDQAIRNTLNGTTTIVVSGRSMRIMRGTRGIDFTTATRR